MKITRFAVSAALLSIFAVGCAATTDAPEAEGTDETSEAMTVRNALVGKWDSDTGTIYKLELTRDYAETLGGFLKGRRFEATVDNGVRCITTPCPSSDTVSGVYAVDGGKITFASYDKPSQTFSRYLGDYRFTVSAKKLTLKKTDGTVSGSFHHAPAGEPCGNVVCGQGTVCCNPVMSICTKPGMVCIQ
jgi:hypothetical protein